MIEEKTYEIKVKSKIYNWKYQNIFKRPKQKKKN
jgi:hypothetical protein